MGVWWGGGGGHDVFKWSHYQNEEAIAAMLADTSRQLLGYGFRVLVLMAGHYPWQGFLDTVVPILRREFPDALILAGTEISICGDAVQLKGDHAARDERGGQECNKPVCPYHAKPSFRITRIGLKQHPNRGGSSCGSVLSCAHT